MNTETTLLLDLARRTDPEQFPFLALSQNHLHGWRSIFAWNPEKIFIFDGDQDSLDKFFHENRKRIIAGFIDYDTGMELLGVTSDKPSLTSIPRAWFAAYENYAVVENGRLAITGKYNPKEKILQQDTPKDIRFKALTDRKIYDKALYKIKEHIINGDIYQANLTHFLEAEWNGDPWELFGILYSKNPVDFGACLLNPDFSIFSLSPEKFISHTNNSLVTEPIKGTRPRGRSEKEDARERDLLISSPKEAAELNMITDLLRNDLGKICKTGSVELVRHRETMALPSVWHTYSTIKGELSDDTSFIQGLLSMLPGGSITGCPKKRAVEIISGLEDYRRGLYTGTIGYQLPDGSSTWNIAIRTLIHEKERLLLGVGGGITLDSVAEDEYNETLAKAKSFMEIQA